MPAIFDLQSDINDRFNFFNLQTMCAYTLDFCCQETQASVNSMPIIIVVVRFYANNNDLRKTIMITMIV